MGLGWVTQIGVQARARAVRRIYKMRWLEAGMGVLEECMETRS